MSIVETYKNEFTIYSYDEDLLRGQKTEECLKAEGYNYVGFSSRGVFLEALESGNLPHVFVLYYQPLNLKFRELLKKMREASSEVEIVVLGSNEFWPGIESLQQAGLINDFWSWPFADQKALQMRLDQLIEKTIYKYIAEQRSEATASIVKRLEEQKEKAVETVMIPTKIEADDVLSFMSDHGSSEPRMVEDLISQLKKTFTSSDFIYLKNYPARDQLLVMKTSFSSEKYFRGQQIAFDQELLNTERGEAYQRVRTLLQESFDCHEFVLQPVELASDFFGFIMAVNFDNTDFLKRTASYLSISLRNSQLESAQKGPDLDLTIEQDFTPQQFPLALSTEVSRARRLRLPLSLIILHLEHVQSEPRERAAAMDMIRNNLRGYDLICSLDDEKIAIALPHCDYKNAAIKAETIRRQLVARGLKTQNTPLRLCFGVSEFPSLSQDSDSLRVDAHKACAQVLASGKNKVCLYTAPKGFEAEFSVSL